MNPQDFIPFCKKSIRNFYLTNGIEIGHGDIFEVWYSKTLENSKALLSTTRSDGLYFEMTLNGNKNEVYMDVYAKQHNTALNIDRRNRNE